MFFFINYVKSEIIVYCCMFDDLILGKGFGSLYVEY